MRRGVRLFENELCLKGACDCGGYDICEAVLLWGKPALNSFDFNASQVDINIW